MRTGTLRCSGHQSARACAKRPARRIALFFELDPQAALRQQYLDIAAGLAAQLEEVDGFISIERYAWLSRPGCILALSILRDEQAFQHWRGTPAGSADRAQLYAR